MTLVICACSAALNPEKSMAKERIVNSCDGWGVTWSESGSDPCLWDFQYLEVSSSAHMRERQVYFY
jgi:hypothetical protein